MAKKKHTIEIILFFLLIIATLLGILGYKSIPELLDNLSKSPSLPFEVKISPTYFDEGNYNYNHDIPISIEIDEKLGRNITYLEFSEENFKSTRKDNGLNKPASDVRWEDSRNSNLIFCDESRTYSYCSFPKEAKGEMAICKNCFIGDNYPYVFTFTIYYKESGEELKTETFNEIIPIK